LHALAVPKNLDGLSLELLLAFARFDRQNRQRGPNEVWFIIVFVFLFSFELGSRHLKRLVGVTTLVLFLGLTGCSPDDPNTRLKPLDPNIPFPKASGMGAGGGGRAKGQPPADKTDKSDKTDAADKAKAEKSKDDKDNADKDKKVEKTDKADKSDKK
jgi:hypothetical protein